MNKKLIGLMLMLLIAVLDQLSKNYIMSFLKSQVGMVYEICPILDLVYTWNYGISFGIFTDYYQYSNKVFLVIVTLIILFLLHEYRKLKNQLEIFGLSMIIGGALGNLIDRILKGAVFDFLHFHYESYYFAAFNLADAAITLGVFFILIKILFVRSEN